MMKKIYTKAIVMMMSMAACVALTSCDTDEVIADKLTDTNWEGCLDTYYVNRWGDSFLDGEFHTVWCFYGSGYDPHYGTATWGTGYEVDYSVYDRGEYAYSSFRWEVRSGNIYITYDDPTWNPVRIDWVDYSLTYSHFRGTMYDWEDRAYHFDLYSNSSWSWDRYRYRTRAVVFESNADMPIYFSKNGSSKATGRFAEALQKMASE